MLDKEKSAPAASAGKCCFDENLRELKEHGTAENPVVFYESVFHRHSDYGLHWHKELELVYVQTGRVVFRINQNELAAKAGDLVFVPRGAMHSVKYAGAQAEPARLISLLFDPEILKSPTQEYCQKKLVHPLLCGQLIFPYLIEPDSKNYEGITGAFQSLYTCFKQEAPFYQIRFKGLLFELFYNFLSGDGYSYNRQVTNKTVSAITGVIEYIQSHYSEDIYIGRLAEMANYNENYFMKVFRDYTGKTIVKFINDYRLEKSKELLLNSELSIDEIAYKTGFSSASYYIRAFKSKYHFTPKEFRNNAPLI